MIDLYIHNRGSMICEGPASIGEGSAEDWANTTSFGVEDVINVATASLVPGEGALALPMGTTCTGEAMVG